jgi:Domain of unknown function (DUF5916)/Carbohydrate family 9 binding domain-like
MARGGRVVNGFAAALWLAGATVPAFGQVTIETTRFGTVPHATGVVVIDGVLDEPVWSAALVIPLGIETNPRENVTAAVMTFAHVVEDGANLLIAFDARDPEPDKIRAYLRDRDSAYNDDFVGVVLDTFNDQRRAFEFFVNPLGVQMDLTFDDVNGREDDSWNAIWESAGTIHADGYTVEISIPFSQLRFPRTDGPQVWGIDVLRFYPRKDRSRLSSNAQNRGRNCYLCQLGKIDGFAAAEPGRGLEVVPALTATRTDERDESTGELVEGDTETEVGVNVRWGVTPDLVANLAINPDFSQVEADIAQLDVNNQFALFFPETRPFFLEGADLFVTPIDAVFTRTVADPDVGVKLTGTSNRNTFGVFAAEDAVTNLLFPGPLSSSSDSLEQSNDAFVGRYRRDFGANSTVGALVTTRVGDGYHNHVAGLDGRYRPNDRHSLAFQVLGSDTAYPDAVSVGDEQPTGTFSGAGTQLRYEYGAREWQAFADYRRFDPDFRADAGFLTQVDIDGRIVGFTRIWHGDGVSWWNRVQAGANFGSNHAIDGRLLARFREIVVGLQGPLQSFSQLVVSRQQQFWDGALYDIDDLFLFGQIRPASGLTISFNGRYGDQVDYVNSRLGRQLRLEPRVEWNINRHLLLRAQHTAVRFEDQSSDTIFDADLTDLRLTWQFSIRSFLRLTMQQQIVDRNLALFTDPDTDAHSESRAMQLLYSYQLNPQTVFFLGYSNNHIEDDELLRLTETDRTLFVKLSYAWTP